MLLLLACVIIYQQQYLKTHGDHHLSQDERRRRSFSVHESPLSHICFHLKRQRSNTLGVRWWFVVHCASSTCTYTFSYMGTKMKGIYKGFKYTLSQIFVVKEEPEMEIGGPTDVKHVAHIGWEGPSGSAPSWMNEFRPGQDYAATSIGNSGSALSPWSSQDFGDQSMRQQSESDMSKEHPRIKKRRKERKQSRLLLQSRVPPIHQGRREQESRSPNSSRKTLNQPTLGCRNNNNKCKSQCSSKICRKSSYFLRMQKLQSYQNDVENSSRLSDMLFKVNGRSCEELTLLVN